MSLLSLPDELLIRVLSYLPPSDLLSAQLTSHHLNTTVTSSVWLQYRTLLKTAQYSDNPSCPLGIRDRLSALKKQEEAWASLRPTFTKEIEVQHQPCGIYEVTGGLYLSGDKARRNLFWVQLPPQDGDKQVWRMIDMGPELLVVEDIGLCVYEHDLIGVVTTSPRPSMPATYTTQLHLLQLSTSSSSSRPTPHPLAAQNPLHILDSPHKKSSVWLQIVGDHLALVITPVFPHALDKSDKVFVYNWCSGHMVARLNAPHGSYHGIVFLTESWFLLPNAKEGRLEVYEIPTHTEAHLDAALGVGMTPVHILALPALERRRNFSSITCRGEPNPVSERCTKLHTTIPCYPSPEDAIIIFILRVSGFPLPFGEYDPSHDLSMYVHRRTVLDVCRRDSLARSPTGRSNANPPPPIPYRVWGPPITRWFNIDDIPHRRITTTAGQRAVIISELVYGHATPYVVLDFNQGNVHRAGKALGHHDGEVNSSETKDDGNDEDDDQVEIEDTDWRVVDPDSSEDVDRNRRRDARRMSRLLQIRDTNPEYPYAHPYTHSPNPNAPPNRWLTTAFHSVEPTNIFDRSEWPVGGSLPYVACSSAKGYFWDGAMMDGERVMGCLVEADEDEGVPRVVRVQVVGFG